MSSKTFLDIYNSMDKTLIPPEKYYSAHRLEDELELLEDHSDLCSNYFLHIVDKLGLESILNNIIIDYFGQDQLLKIKQIVIYGIYYHDIGKINHNFQMNRVNGQKIKGNTNHSYFSHRILTAFLLKKFPDLKEIIFLITYIIQKHHERLRNYSVNDNNESQEEREIIQQILLDVKLTDQIIDEVEKKKFFINNCDPLQFSKLYFLLKLLYSLLVLSDSYSTFHYSSSLKEMYPLKTINKELHKNMIKSFSKIKYNKNIDEMEIQDVSKCQTINELRTNVLIESHTNLKRLLNDSNKIFMLSVPTGGGKTNISMKLALDILSFDSSIKKIFYVFPYINIIEQNYQSIKSSLLNDPYFSDKYGIISDIYSRAYLNKFHDDVENNDNMELKKIMVIKDDNFLNNDINVITSVNFFNGIIKNGGNNRYKIANLCNSIVIIDELQTLSDKNIRIFYDFINVTSRIFNIYYILMSATLPNINYFIDDINVPQVISNPQKYFLHRVFRRNQIIFKKEVRDIEGIKNLLKKEIDEHYEAGDVKILITLNLVNTSRKVYEALKVDEDFKDFSFYILNSTISSLRRKKIIEDLKEKSNINRKIIVTTQSIEAGVDIDCDFGIRDFSILDSIEQISGRINRECNPIKANISKLYIIKYSENEKSDCKKIYGDLDRYKLLLKYFNQNDIERILTNKEFDKYYYTLSNELKKIAKDSYSPIQKEIFDLHYQEINNKLNVIENKIEKIDIFICDEILLEDLSDYDRDQIQYLISDPEISKFDNKYKIIQDTKIITKNVYNIWKGIMTSTKKFEDIYIRRKITSLFNQFIVSINNVKNISFNLGMDEYLSTNGLVEINDNFNINLSTSDFLNYYSFEDGIRLDKLKQELKEFSGCVLI